MKSTSAKVKTMNLEEYRNRIDKAHTVTGVPSYWLELQAAVIERDRWKQIADSLADGIRDAYGDNGWRLAMAALKEYDEETSRD